MKRLIVLLNILLFVASANAATAYRPYSWTEPSYIELLDSVEIKPFRGTDTIATNSITVTSFPAAGNITIDDLVQWRIEYYYYWDGKSTPDFGDEMIYGSGAIDIITPGSSSMITIFLQYFPQGVAKRGAKLTIRNENVATDSTTGVILGPIYDFDFTDTLGTAQVQVPKSHLYSDSLLGLYDISLQYRGKDIKLWEDIWAPDQDSLRLVVP